MRKKDNIFGYVRFDKDLCTGCANCMKACPTLAIRIKNSKSIRLVDSCVGCGECIRVCPEGAVSAATGTLDRLNKDQISVALVTPVLYAQFPGVMPKDVLLGLHLMGFQHTVDMSYFLEMFRYATEEFIIRNRDTKQAPWPLISPICPVVIRLIAFKFPNLMPHVLPLLTPVAIMARDVKQRIIQKYGVSEDKVVLCYIIPCPTKRGPIGSGFHQKGSHNDFALGINDIYADLVRQLEKIKQADQIPYVYDRFDFEYCHTGNGPMWGMSGGEIADMNIDNTLAVSGLNETITYLEKIEMGLFSNLEYIEFRTCPEGCLGGAIAAIDKYLAKSYVNKMVKTLGLGRRLSRDTVLRLYEKGMFRSHKNPDKLIQLFAPHQEPMSITKLQKIDSILERIPGHDCAVCGAPDCRTFAEDVVKGEASLKECLMLHARRNASDRKGRKKNDG